MKSAAKPTYDGHVFEGLPFLRQGKKAHASTGLRSCGEANGGRSKQAPLQEKPPNRRRLARRRKKRDPSGQAGQAATKAIDKPYGKTAGLPDIRHRDA
jgi:hypothetical protein